MSMPALYLLLLIKQHLKPHVNTIKIHYNYIFKIYKIDKSLCIKLCVAHTFKNKNSKCLWTVIYNSTLYPDLHIFPHNDRDHWYGSC